MKLIATQIKEAKPRDKDYKLSDGGGMYLLVKKTGGKYWRIDYRYKGKRKTIALGVYPQITLKTAREKRAEIKHLLDQNIDPSETRKEEKRQEGALTFADVAKRWWEYQCETWTSNHADRIWRRLTDDVFPDIGRLTMDEITPKKVIAITKKIEDRGALDVANRVKQNISAVFKYAIQREIATYNPAGDLEGIVKKRLVTHRPSLPREELPLFLNELSTYHHRGRPITQWAIELLVLTFVRSRELRGARWDEFDIPNKLWRIPAQRMKMKNEHLVPLSDQAIEILEQLRPLTGCYELLFPSERNRDDCMSDNTMRRAIFKLGYDGNTEGKSKAVPHGFRATASSILNEQGFNPDAIERQLAHKETNTVRAAYIHHARYMDERTTMMQWWADYLDQLKQQHLTSNVVVANFK